jgi:queuine/archaeosine tRNA-ribosyltransferase
VGTPRRSCPRIAPRYLMGSGMPDDLIECVARGHRSVRLRAADEERAQSDS